MPTTTQHNTIYLDHSATTPLDIEVHEEMSRIGTGIYGNPSSMHHQGRLAFDLLENARRSIATTLGSQPSEIIFTGSGTESDNLAIIGIAHAYQEHGKHIIVSAIEHKAVLAAAKHLETEGFEVTYLPVDTDGLINIDACIRAIRPDTILVSIMYANNEIGTIQPIAELSTLLKKNRGQNVTPLLHTDACQAVGMLPITVSEIGADAMTINSSKIYGPKGIGLLYVKNGLRVEPVIVGGDQELGKRAGTENVILAHGFAVALSNACNTQLTTHTHTMELRDYFMHTLCATHPDIVLNGHQHKRLPNNLHISIPHLEGESLVLQLDQYGICCSTGSACSAVDLEPSHVLRAIGVDDELIHGSLRFSLGKTTTIEDINYTLRCLTQCIETLRTITAMPHMRHKKSV